MQPSWKPTGALALVLAIVAFAALTSQGAGAQGREAGPSMKPSAIRAIPAETTAAKAAAQGECETLTPEKFARRAGGDEASRDRAVNQETFLRNEFGVRTFGYTSFIVDPPNGQMPGTSARAGNWLLVSDPEMFVVPEKDRPFDVARLFDRRVLLSDLRRLIGAVAPGFRSTPARRHPEVFVLRKPDAPPQRQGGGRRLFKPTRARRSI